MSPAKVRRFVTYCVAVLAAAVVPIAATQFSYDAGRPLSAEELAKSRQYYAEAYHKETPAEEQPPSEYDTKYLKIGAEAAEAAHVREQVSDFAAKYGLQDGAVLDIGSGRGYLQDVVENYVARSANGNRIPVSAGITGLNDAQTQHHVYQSENTHAG
jgi:cyclopropane fatty-acyl-phospholipid synthase-like methyltransferase